MQACVEQHADIARFNPTSVNTLRLTLYRSVVTDECVVPSAIIRIGGKGSVVDNAHAGGGYVGIDVKTGRLCHRVLNQWGHAAEVFNGMDFRQDFAIPYWPEVLAFAKSVGYYVPHHRLLALDLTLSPGGDLKLIEFNCEYYSMWLFQFTVGGALGEWTDEVIDYCKREKGNLEYQVLL